MDRAKIDYIFNTSTIYGLKFYYRDIWGAILSVGTVDQFKRYLNTFHLKKSMLYDVIDRNEFVECIVKRNAMHLVLDKSNYDTFLVQYFSMRGMQEFPSMWLKKINDDLDDRIAKIKPLFQYFTFGAIIRDYLVADDDRVRLVQLYMTFGS